MRRAGVHRLLVMRGQALVGIVTTSDVARAVGEHHLHRTRPAFDQGADFDARGWR